MNLPTTGGEAAADALRYGATIVNNNWTLLLCHRETDVGTRGIGKWDNSTLTNVPLRRCDIGKTQLAPPCDGTRKIRVNFTPKLMYMRQNTPSVVNTNAAKHVRVGQRGARWSHLPLVVFAEGGARHAQVPKEGLAKPSSSHAAFESQDAFLRTNVTQKNQAAAPRVVSWPPKIAR